LLQRAKKAGYKVLFGTLETHILGWRPSDTDNRYNPFLRADNIEVELGFTDPVFQKHFREKYGKSIEVDKSAAAAEWTRTTFSGLSRGWEDVKFLKEHWGGVVVLNGIQTMEDAVKCIEVAPRWRSELARHVAHDCGCCLGRARDLLRLCN
jgi:lactate 2-monooxygenase